MGKTKEQPKLSVAKICEELQALQRRRAWHLKSRNMIHNRLIHTVAGTLGYSSGLEEKERAAFFKEAREVIKQAMNDEIVSEENSIIKTAMEAVDAFDRMKLDAERRMKVFAKTLPVAKWVEHKDQCGFGLLFLAIVIGETGDLSNYANPAKVWRRMGCAPWTFDGKTAMGCTWRCGAEGKLPAAEWEEFGYSPRRRSIAFLIGEGMVKQNGAREKPKRKCGPYRLRYDETKVTFAEKHPEYKRLRCHLHGMLLATKLLLKNLWIEWHK